MNQTLQNICLYDHTKKSEINIIIHRINSDQDLIRKIEKILPTIINKERTSRELKGMISIKNIEIDYNKNLIKQIEDIPNCI